MTPTPANFPASLEPDVTQALRFFAALYGNAYSMIHMRGVPEPKDSRTPKNLHYVLDETFPATLKGFLEWCAVESRAAFFLPGVVKSNQGTGKVDVESLPAICVDFDKGNPADNLAAVEAIIGPATVVVESGGSVDGHAKLHAYWRLDKPATGAAIDEACRIREELAKRFGGDPAFKQPAQVIRIPGSIHFKGTPKLVRLRDTRATVVELAGVRRLLRMVDAPSNVVDFFDFNTAKPHTDDVERALTQITHEGAVDDMTRFDAAGKAIGHFLRMVREGRYSIDDAWQATRDWNAANLSPPWSEERLRNDFERLARIDKETHGPIVPPALPAFVPQAAEGWSISRWQADAFLGRAPERRWLVDGLIPSNTAGLFAAVGDAGKSMLALRLALYITTYPAVGPIDTSSPRFFGCPVVARGAAVILTAEDDAAEVHRRLEGLDPTSARRGQPLYVVPMISDGGARCILADGPNGPYPTPFWSELKSQLEAIPDLKLVVLDPLSSFVGADINKDNLAGAILMAMLGELAATTGAAIMLVHHFSKGNPPTDLSDARGAIRGAGALVDNSRWSIVLWEADEGDAKAVLKKLEQPERAAQAGIVYFGGLAKSNAPGAKVIRTMVRGPSGILEDVTDALRAATPRADELDDSIHKALVQHHQTNPRWSIKLGRTSIHQHVVPVLKRAGVDVGATVTLAVIERLIERGAVVETDDGKAWVPVS